MPTDRPVLRQESLSGSGIISLAGSACAAIASLVLTAVIGNGLGTSGTGIFFQAIAVFTILSQVLRLGTNSAIIRTISGRRAHDQTDDSWRVTLVATIPVLVISLVVAAVIALFSPVIAEWLSPRGHSDDLSDLLVLMAPFVVAGAVLAVLHTVVRMTRGVVAFTLLQSVFLPLSRLALALAAVTLAWGATGAFLGWMVVIPLWLVVTLLVLIRPLRRDHRTRYSRSQTTDHISAREFWSFSAPRAVGGALETALDWSDVVIVAALTSPAQAGIYAVATRTLRAGQIVDRAMRIAVSPAISRLLATGRLEAARVLHTSVARAMILMTWPYYLTLAVMGPGVIRIFGEDFESGATVLAILAGAMMIAAAAGMLQSVLLQGGNSTWQMYNKTVVLAVNVGLNLLLVPLLGIAGAAISWATSLLVDTAIAAFQVHSRMRVRLEPGALLFSMVPPLVVFGLGWLVVRMTVGPTLLAVAIGLPVLAALYIGVLWALRRRLDLESLWAKLPGRTTAKPKQAKQALARGQGRR